MSNHFPQQSYDIFDVQTVLEYLPDESTVRMGIIFLEYFEVGIDSNCLVYIVRRILSLKYTKLDQPNNLNQKVSCCIRLENIYYCSLMNQITLLHFGRSVQEIEVQVLMILIYQKLLSIIQIQILVLADLMLQIKTSLIVAQCLFNCIHLLRFRIKQKILNYKEILHACGDKGVFNLITDIHNKKTSTLIYEIIFIKQSFKQIKHF